MPARKTKKWQHIGCIQWRMVQSLLKMQLYSLILLILLTGCWNQGSMQNWVEPRDTIVSGSSDTGVSAASDIIVIKHPPVSTTETPVADASQHIWQESSHPTASINTGKTTPSELLAFAQTQVGIPYKYASIDPKVGFDCSGFVTYVFNHFNIRVPRSSVDFTHVGKEINVGKARPGDLILFTGTDSTIRVVGHMGIVMSNRDGNLLFIHSSSGKAKGVVITPMERYYLSRFVKVIRVFPE